MKGGKEVRKWQIWKTSREYKLVKSKYNVHPELVTYYDPIVSWFFTHWTNPYNHLPDQETENDLHSSISLLCSLCHYRTIRKPLSWLPVAYIRHAFKKKKSLYKWRHVSIHLFVSSLFLLLNYYFHESDSNFLVEYWIFLDAV